LGLSVKRQGSRYQHLPGTRLRHAAMRVSRATGASTVIFGHTHVEDGANGYVNLGSFAFSRDQGRPYIELDATGQAHRRRFV
jgi:predicted phosphodiesterase